MLRATILKRRTPWLQTGRVPVLTYRGVFGFTVAGASVNAIAGSIALGPESENRLVIVNGALGTNTTQIPRQLVFNGVELNIWDHTTGAAGQFSFIASGIVPRGTSMQAMLRASAAMGNGEFGAGGVWTLTGYASPVPRSIAKATDVAQTVLNVDLNTEVNGVAICIGQNNTTASQSFTLTGDQAVAEQAESATNGSRAVWGHIADTVADTANTLTCTAGQVSTTGMSWLAAAWR